MGMSSVTMTDMRSMWNLNRAEYFVSEDENQGNKLYEWLKKGPPSEYIQY